MMNKDEIKYRIARCNEAIRWRKSAVKELLKDKDSDEFIIEDYKKGIEGYKKIKEDWKRKLKELS